MIRLGLFTKINRSDVKSEMKKRKQAELDEMIQRKKHDMVIIDRSITKYIIDNFSDVALDIRDSLLNLSDTLENTIDYIEDRSSIVVKDSRNFKLSQDYREKSIKIYEVVESIKDYVSWIEKGYIDMRSNKEICDNEETKFLEAEELDNKICITEDFTSKCPKAFKIDEYYLEVSDWKELTVKAADILTKNYKNTRNSCEVSFDKVVLKESIENDFRDSVIDILKIYGVPLNKFYVYVEQ